MASPTTQRPSLQSNTALPNDEENQEPSPMSTSASTDDPNSDKSRPGSPSPKATDDNPASLAKPISVARIVGLLSKVKSNNEQQQSKDDGAAPAEAVVAENKGEEAPPQQPLSKSNRLKGYIALLVFSIINLSAGIQSIYFPIPPKTTQRRYAIAVSSITAAVTGVTVLMHLDRFTPLKTTWKTFFGPKAKVELILLISLTLWWVIATWVNTTAGGIAGEGSLQLNLYFSTWICVIVCFWTIERFRKASGQISTGDFLSQMPACSAAWTTVVLSNLLVFSFTVHLYHYIPSVTYETSPYMYLVYVANPPASYQWLLIELLSCFSFIFGLAFVLIELFRSGKKSDCENMVEGIVLCCLTFAWIPTVTIVTVPGGIAEILGNTYIWSWVATVTVLRTFSKWIRAWRESIHDMVEKQVIEYEKAKRNAVRQISSGGEEPVNNSASEKGPSSPK